MNIFIVEEYIPMRHEVVYAWQEYTLEAAVELAKTYIHEDGVRIARIFEYGEDGRAIREIPKEEWPGA
jgi:hypothetical protein